MIDWRIWKLRLGNHIIAELVEVEEGCYITDNNVTYHDGHKEGVLHTPDDEMYAITTA